MHATQRVACFLQHMGAWLVARVCVWTVPIKSRFFCDRVEKTDFTVAEKQARKVMKSRWRFSWILATLAAATFNATDGADLESRYGCVT
jgi:hypothetical protein